jgi:hypothetical protein
MTVIGGWVERESFPVKNKSARQEATGIGCHRLSDSDCMALKGRPSMSKFETGFLSFMDCFPGTRQEVILHSRAFAPRFTVEHSPKCRCKIVAHSANKPKTGPPSQPKAGSLSLLSTRKAAWAFGKMDGKSGTIKKHPPGCPVQNWQSKQVLC